LSHTAIGVEEALMARPSRERSGFEVLSVGRLIRIKNFDLTIRAFALLARREPTARLTIVGDGPMQESLEQLAEELGIRDRVHFAGHVPRDAAGRRRWAVPMYSCSRVARRKGWSHWKRWRKDCRWCA
jgi:glycosyltransferase involved in cell wall biosynthesis